MTDSGIIFDLKKFAIHDGPGIRTTVFLKGCPLDCKWCHNPESRNEGIEQLKVCTPRRSPESGGIAVGCRIDADQLMTELLQDRIFYDRSGGGVTFSGGEPLLQVDFLANMLARCRGEGIHTAIDTSGFVPWESFEKVVHRTNLFLYDLKLMDEVEHIGQVGVSNGLILENLSRLAAEGVEIIIRVPLIPEVTDTDENLDAVARFLNPYANLRRINILPYNKLGEDKRQRYQMPADREYSVQDDNTIEKKRHRLQEHGFLVTVGG